MEFLVQLRHRLARGINLPPAGWTLAGLLAFYVIAGLFGRDPWKGEDAIHITTAWHVLSQNDWLSPNLAGRVFDEPPLYYWSAALTGKLLGWLLPLHDALRFASGLWVALALTGLYYAGRELYGQQSAAASPLLLAGSAGLIVHAHDAQPMLVALAAYGGTIGSIALFGRRPRLAGIFYGISLAACLLSTGIATSLPLLAAGPLATLLGSDKRRHLLALAIGWVVAALLIAPWPLALWEMEPARFSGWLSGEMDQLSEGLSSPGGTGRYLALLTWMAFPTLPLAAWALWTRRRELAKRPQSLPLAFLVVTLVVLAITYRPRETPALLLLPPLALLATPGVLALRRGAANAFDWFSMMTFSLFAAVVWLAWSAMALGWPERLAKRVVILRPGFVGHPDWLACAIGLVVTLWWGWLIATAPRSPYRSLTHWTMGFTATWLLAVALLLPWFDYGKSYRPVVEAVAKELPAQPGCIAERGLGDTQRASLAYFARLEPLPAASEAGRRCDWLIVQGPGNRPNRREWSQAWEGSRPGDRREKLYLFQRK